MSDIWSKIGSGAYANPDPFPTAPRKPSDRFLGSMTAAEARAYADSLEAYETQMVEFKNQRKAWYDRRAALEQEFRDDLETCYNMTGHPKATLLWNKSWERGHGSGLNDVACVYSDLVELVI